MVSRWHTFLAAIGLAGLLSISVLRGIGPAEAEGQRLVLAFYYAWYDHKTWNSGKVPDVPQSPYVSTNRDVMARQIDQAKGAGIDAFVLNWWGRGNQTEKNLQALLDVAGQKGFRVAVDFDINSPFMGGVNSYAENLRHLHNVHAAHSAYLRAQGRPVVFFYNVSRLSVAAWRKLRDQADPDRQALWIAEGTDLRYQAVFDGHHLYSVTWPNRIPPAKTLPAWGQRVRKYNAQNGTAKLWVATVMPGYDDRKVRPGSGFAQSRNGGDYYRQSWQAAIASRPQWVIINSFNEWPEGTYIEPSQAHGGLYLDITRDWAARFKQADFTALSVPPPAPTAPPPTPTPVPSPTPVPTPAVRIVPYEEAATRLYLDQGCGYVVSDTGAEQVWHLFCPVYSSLDDQMQLVY